MAIEYKIITFNDYKKLIRFSERQRKMAKKKWYDTWWGLLWTLALVDANPGRGVQMFLEVDEELKHLPEFENSPELVEQNIINESKTSTPCPEVASAEC